MQRRGAAVSNNGCQAGAPCQHQHPQAARSRPRRTRRRQKSSSLLVYYALYAFLIVLLALLWWGVHFPTSRMSRGAQPNEALTRAHLEAIAAGGSDQHAKQDSDAKDPRLAWNPLYRIPESMGLVGDRGDAYVQLRQRVDALLATDSERSLRRLAELRQPYHLPQAVRPMEDPAAAYDIYNCPDEPPPGYPYQWNLAHAILRHWPVNEPSRQPEQLYQGLCVFDYSTDYDKAQRYRSREVPFIVSNDPRVAKTVERWNQPGYMNDLLDGVDSQRAYGVEHNTNNHFLYFIHQKKDKTKHLRDTRGRAYALQRGDVMAEKIQMTYAAWLAKANVTDESKLGPTQDHWYFRLISCGVCSHGAHEFLFDELPFFQPREELYLVDGSKQAGIHCRFGMKGVIAENHYDSGRNAIALLSGSRRYILSHPNQCDKLALLPQGHDSARHSRVDYTNPDLETFPEFGEALANEVVLHPGDVLYLPSRKFHSKPMTHCLSSYIRLTHPFCWIDWFHYIVSLEVNMQCNTRSGRGPEYDGDLARCGFPP
jgi:hypothetical protein